MFFFDVSSLQFSLFYMYIIVMNSIICLLSIQNEHISKKVLNLINKLGATLLTTKVVGEKPSVYHTDKLEMILDRQRPAKISGKTLGKRREKVILPSADDLIGPDSTHLPSVDAQVRS